MNKMDHGQVCWADTQYNQVVNKVTDSFKTRFQASPMRMSFVPISATEKLNLYDVRTRGHHVMRAMVLIAALSVLSRVVAGTERGLQLVLGADFSRSAAAAQSRRGRRPAACPCHSPR